MIRFLIPLFAAVILISCSSITGTDSGDGGDVSTTKHQVTEDEGAVDPVHGTETWFAIGPITGIGDVSANGVAQAYVFEDGQSVFVAQVNIAVPPEGAHYEGWLLGKNGDLIQVGTFENVYGDVRHQLKAEIPQDIRLYPTFQVTLETDGDDPRSQAAVAGATLEHHER